MPSARTSFQEPGTGAVPGRVVSPAGSTKAAQSNAHSPRSLWLAWAAPSFAATPGVKLPPVQRTQLPNGAQIALVEKHDTPLVAMTVTVRALAMRELGRRNIRRIVTREVLVGFVNGLGLAVLLGLGAGIWFEDPQLGAVIGVSQRQNFLQFDRCAIAEAQQPRKVGIDVARLLPSQIVDVD